MATLRPRTLHRLPATRTRRRADTLGRAPDTTPARVRPAAAPVDPALLAAGLAIPLPGIRETTGSATCPDCGCRVKLRTDGTLRRHRVEPDNPTAPRCGT